MRGESVFGMPDHLWGIEQIASDEPTPEVPAKLGEEYERLLGLLRDDKLRQIAILRMESYSNEEIAEKL